MTYYACFELKVKNSDCIGVIKIPFESRELAREYIATHFDENIHSKCWTE